MSARALPSTETPIDDVETPVTFYERLKLAMKHAGRESRDVAGAMGVTVAALRGLKSTGGQARADNALRAADYLHVNPHWLILGEGQMLERGPSWPFGQDLTPAQWQSLPTDARTAASNLLKHLVHAQK